MPSTALITNDTINKKPTLKTSANDKMRCLMKLTINATCGDALTRHTRFSAYCNCPNTVLAPSNVRSAPIASDHWLRSSLPVCSMTVCVSDAPSSPTSRRICSMSCMCTWPSAKNVPATLTTTSNSGAIDKSE